MTRITNRPLGKIFSAWLVALPDISNNVGPVNSFVSKPLHPLRGVVFVVRFDLCIDDHGSLINLSVGFSPT